MKERKNERKRKKEGKKEGKKERRNERKKEGRKERKKKERRLDVLAHAHVSDGSYIWLYCKCGFEQRVYAASLLTLYFASGV